MRDRIRYIMEQKQLNAAQFADRIQVSRSAITNLLGARNNASLDLVYNILNAFPDISIEWLMYGRGEMNNGKYTDDLDVKPLSDPSSQIVINEVASQKTVETVVVKEIVQKEVQKILIFYADNTFATFIPEKLIDEKT